MRYYKVVENGYILGFGIGNSGLEIQEIEYNTLSNIVQEKAYLPGIVYRLREDLSWEETPEPDPELDGDEIIDILLGGAT